LFSKTFYALANTYPDLPLVERQSLGIPKIPEVEFFATSIRAKPEALTVPLEISQVWSRYFMHDQLGDGRTFRLFNMIADYNGESIGIGPD
jgi:hypothetical protein